MGYCHHTRSKAAKDRLDKLTAQKSSQAATPPQAKQTVGSLGESPSAPATETMCLANPPDVRHTKKQAERASSKDWFYFFKHVHVPF